jgi:hypothetical protein
MLEHVRGALAPSLARVYALIAGVRKRWCGVWIPRFLGEVGLAPVEHGSRGFFWLCRGLFAIRPSGKHAA